LGSKPSCCREGSALGARVGRAERHALDRLGLEALALEDQPDRATEVAPVAEVVGENFPPATCTVRCTSVRQWYVNSSATEARSTSSGDDAVAARR
jgi:hypothetical protein